MQKLRLLNFDDLFLLRLLLEGSTITATAGLLGLTQPAITQRVRKIEKIFGCQMFQRSGRRVTLTSDGRALCNRATAALSLMGDVSEDARATVVNIGTRPEVGMSWLWPSLAELRVSHPQFSFHCQFGSGEEILRLLAGSVLDGVLSSAPQMMSGFGAIDVAEENYVFVAAPALAREVKQIDDLKRQVPIEYDRSFAFLRYVDPAQRATLRYRDVWFLGSTNSMRSAILAGFGVGIIPEYLAAASLTSGKLQRILPAIRIDSDHFRLIFRQDAKLSVPIQLLAESLQKIGLQ